jgi:hypothetical protein
MTWLKQWLVFDFLVAESEEPICILEQLQKMCGGTTAVVSSYVVMPDRVDEQIYGDCLMNNHG